LAERRRQWIQDVFEPVLQKARSAHDSLARKCSTWGLPAPTLVAIPEQPQLEVHFNRLSSLMMSRWNVQSCPIPDMSVSALFELAVTRDAAFEKVSNTLTGFQDTVVLISAIEHLKKTVRSHGVLVSNDHVFTSGSVRRFTSHHKVELTVSKRVADVISALDHMLQPSLCAWRQRPKRSSSSWKRTSRE
jgi:hypothetical protein